MTSSQLTTEALRLSRLIGELARAKGNASHQPTLYRHLKAEMEVAMDQFRALEAEARSVLGQSGS